MHLKKKIAILGVGNIGSAIADGLVQSKIIPPSKIAVTRKNKILLQQYSEKGFNTTTNNKKQLKFRIYFLITASS